MRSAGCKYRYPIDQPSPSPNEPIEGGGFSTAWLVLGGLGAVLIVFMVFSLIASRSDNNTSPAPAKDKSIATEEQGKLDAEANFKNMTSAQHIQQARLALEPGATLAAIDEGIRNLDAIPASAPEAAAAKAFKRKLAARAEEDRLEKLSPLERATQQTKLLKFNWHKDGFGSVMIADFTIRNDSPYDVKDIDIRCVHSAPSGTVIDQNTRTVYDLVKAHSTRTFTNVNMGFINSQAESSGCQILNLSLGSER